MRSLLRQRVLGSPSAACPPGRFGAGGGRLAGGPRLFPYEARGSRVAGARQQRAESHGGRSSGLFGVGQLCRPEVT